MAGAVFPAAGSHSRAVQGPVSAGQTSAEQGEGEGGGREEREGDGERCIKRRERRTEISTCRLARIGEQGGS